MKNRKTIVGIVLGFMIAGGAFAEPSSLLKVDVNPHKKGDCEGKNIDGSFLPHTGQLFVGMLDVTAETSQLQNVSRDKKTCAFVVDIAVPYGKQMVLKNSGVDYVFQSDPEGQGLISYRARALGKSSEAHTDELVNGSYRDISGTDHDLVLNKCGEPNVSLEVKLTAVVKDSLPVEPDPEVFVVSESGDENPVETADPQYLDTHLSLLYFQAGFELTPCEIK